MTEVKHTCQFNGWRSVPHPGEFIAEELAARDWGQCDLAYFLDVPEQIIHDLISGNRDIDAAMAEALGRVFDVASEFFVNLQRACTISRA